MRVRILLQISDDDGAGGVAEEVAAFGKLTQRPEDVGLSIADSKALLAAVQRRIVGAQASAWSQRRRCCKVCGRRRRSTGSYPIVFRTPFGDIDLASPRLCRCRCQENSGPATVSPLADLLPDHVAPERLYVETRRASLAPGAAAAGLPADVLPVASGANATTLREHALRVAGRAETELGEERPSFIDGCPERWQELPIPEGRIVVGRDGGCVRNREDRTGNFELIVGRSMPEERSPRYPGLVHGYDGKPRRRPFELLKEQGLQANQDVTFLTDGGEEVRALSELVTPAAGHIPDWFHIAMRLTVPGRYAKGVAHIERAAGDRLPADIERIKWWLWHGNLHRAVPAANDLQDDVEGLEVDYPQRRKFARAAHEFAVCIESNTDSLVNYGERFRAGERIS